MQSRNVSVVIVTYNSASDLGECLAALHSTTQSPICEIVIVDNASTDDTYARLEQYPSVRVIQLATNRGFATAVNIGIANTLGDYILVLNPDVRIQPSSVHVMLQEIIDRPSYAAIGCKMVHPDGRPQISARQFPTVVTFIGRAVLTNHLTRKRFTVRELGAWRDFSHMEGSLTQVDWVLGGCIMIRRRAYSEIGLLDEEYFLYYEDIDWCYRARKAGWKIGYSISTEVVHAHHRSSSKLSIGNRLTRIHFSSACRFFLKFALQRRTGTVF